jgi:hypothetical protein
VILQIHVEGAEKAALDLKGMSDRARAMAPALARVRQILETGERRQFESRGAFFGTPWAALKPSTIAREGAHPVLERSGALKDSLTGHKGRITPTTLTVGPGIWYGRFAASGTSRGEPRRRIVGVHRTDLQASLETVLGYLVGGELV